MGRQSKRNGKKKQPPKFNFRTWGYDKPIPFLENKTMTREMRASLIPSQGGSNPEKNMFQPFLKHMVKVERTERHLVSTMENSDPIPIPGVELLPDEEYQLYPIVYDQMPPIIQSNESEPEGESSSDEEDSSSDVESLTDGEYSKLYPAVYEEMPVSLIQSPEPVMEEELYRPDLGSLPKPEVKMVDEERYDKLYPPVYDKMPLSLVKDKKGERDAEVIRELIKKFIEPAKRNPILVLNKLHIITPQMFSQMKRPMIVLKRVRLESDNLERSAPEVRSFL